MFSIALVVFREVFEISLIVGVLMAATRGLAKRTQWVGIGILLGIAGAALIAFFADTISQAAQGMGQEMLNATILLVAATLIGWTTLWMTRHGRHLTQEFKHIGQEVIKGHKPVYTLAVVVALSALREGAEIVMFTYSAFVTGGKVYQLVMGGLLGTCAGAGAGIVLYYGLTKVPTKKIFAVTSWLLILLVAGMVAQAFGYLTMAGKVPEIIPTVWDTSKIVAENSFLGKMMHVLMGYTDRPSGVQILVYLLTIGGLAMVLKVYGQGGIRPIKKAIVIVAVGLIVFFGSLLRVQAADKVYSPIVEGKGVKEIEVRGSYALDNRASQNNARTQKYAVGYGVTDHWFTEMYGEFAQGPDENGVMSKPKFTDLDWENRYQLFEQGQYWLDAGLYLEYQKSFEHDHADNLEGKILLEKSLPHFTHTANLIVEKEVMAHAKKETEAGVAWSSRYRLSRCIQPGFEYHADFGEVRLHEPYNKQKHQVGPALYGKVGKAGYELGYLFGISPASPDGMLKWNLELEF